MSALERDTREVVDQLAAWAREHEEWRTRACLNLNAANNSMSPPARAALSSRLADKSFSGSPQRRQHPGSRFVDLIEAEIAKLAREIFHAGWVEYRPMSGTHANAVSIFGLVRPGDTIMALPPGVPGHKSYRDEGYAGFRGARVVDIPFDYHELTIDLDEFKARVLEVGPRLIVVGTAQFLFPYELGAIREVADEVGALVHYDAAHPLGLIAGGELQDPLGEGADVLAGSTHKSLPGPIGGLTMTRDEDVGRRIAGVTDSLESNYSNSRVLALGITLAEMRVFGAAYARASIRNARLLAETFAGLEIRPLAAHRGYTDSNVIILDVGEYGLADVLVKRLELANVIASSVRLPAPDAIDHPATGIRIGVQEATRLGMNASEMRELAELVTRVIKGESPELVAPEVSSMARRFTTVYYCFEAPEPPEATTD